MGPGRRTLEKAGAPKTALGGDVFWSEAMHFVVVEGGQSENTDVLGPIFEIVPHLGNPFWLVRKGN